MERSIRRIALIMVAGSITIAAAESGPSAIPAAPDDKTIVHVLNRLGFGPAAGDIDRVRHMGLDKYIERQLHPEQIPDTAMTARLAKFQTLGKSSRELAENYFLPARMERRRAQQQAGGADPAMRPDDNSAAIDKRAMRTPEQAEAMQSGRQVLAELAQQKMLRAVHSERQLEEVMVDFWFNHFSVFAGKGQTRVYLTEYERDAIRPRVLGTFRDLLGATAKSPAMLFYLDNWQSSAPVGARTGATQPVNLGRARLRPGRGGAWGDARTRGGAAAPGQQNRRSRGLNENYARELMELHTLGVDSGYTQKDVQEIARAFSGWTIANPQQSGGFRYEHRMHDDGEKIVLGRRIAAGGGQRDGDQVLDILAAHPATARFIATKIARRFVADDPPAALVERVAARFTATGGDIRETVRTVVTSPEFFATAAYRAKVKSPFEFVASAVRAANMEAVNALPLVQAMRELGMPLYQCQPPTGYADRAEAWVNTGALLNRMNFAVALTGGRMRGTRPLPPVPAGAVARDVIGSGLAGDLSESTRGIVAQATTPEQSAALLLGSPEFQRR